MLWEEIVRGCDAGEIYERGEVEVEWVGRDYGRDDWVRSSIEALIQETLIKDSKIDNSMESNFVLQFNDVRI